MSSNKGPKVIKYSVITSTTAIVLIFISLIPISKKAFYWNQCFKKTFQWIDKNEMELKNWDKVSKESIAVTVSIVLFRNLNLKETNLIDYQSEKNLFSLFNLFIF